MFTYVCQNIKGDHFYIFSGYNTLLVRPELFSFFKIAFEKSIQLPTSLYKDSSIRNGTSLEALVCSIIAKADAKLLKQKLLTDF